MRREVPPWGTVRHTRAPRDRPHPQCREPVTLEQLHSRRHQTRTCRVRGFRFVGSNHVDIVYHGRVDSVYAYSTVLSSTSTGEMRMWYRLFKYVLIGPALLVTCRPRIVGRDLLPPTGPVIVAATHSAFIDSLLLCLVLPRRLTFVAKSEYFDRPGLRGRMQRWFFLAAGQTPIDRSGGDRAATTLATATSLVSRGGAWAIHPEGTRSCDAACTAAIPA